MPKVWPEHSASHMAPFPRILDDAGVNFETSQTANNWFPVATLVIGALLTLLGGLLAERLRWRREDQKETKQDVRSRNEERRAFHLEAAIQLQDAAAALIGAAGGLEGSRGSTLPRDIQVLREANASWREKVATYLVWAARVSDGNIRELARKNMAAQTSWTRASTPDDAEEPQREAWKTFRELNELLGEAIRRLSAE
jgi:hypothetical protein